MENYPKPYIDCTPWSDHTWVGNGSKDCVWFAPKYRKINEKYPQPTLTRRILKTPYLIADRICRKGHSTHDVLEKNGISLFGGSAWWILPDDMAKYSVKIEDSITSNNPFSYIKSVMVPEEKYYQTVLINSKYANRIQVNPEDMVAQNCQTFAYFNPVGKPFTGHPYVFTRDDKKILMDLSSDHLFARKFDMDVDKEIFDWVDDGLINQNIVR